MPQRKSGHVTLLDVAQASGFSVSTVSIVLSDAPLARRVSAKTREQIRTMAQTLGYHPDAHARSLRRRSTQTIGVLAFDLSDPYCIPIMRGIQAGLQSADYLPLVMDAQTQRKLFDHYLTLLLERRVEGLIVIASWVFEETDLLADIRKNKVPIIIIGRDLTARGIPSILVDNEAGGALAMHHLRSLGHRHIAVIRGPQEMSDSAPRWAGIQKVTARSRAALDPELVLQLPGLADALSGFHDACRMVKQLLARDRPFSAVLAFDDLTALGVIRGLSEAGLRVPLDCSVMGFDDVLPAEVSTPAITTIRQPLHAMGVQAATQMLQCLNSTASPSARKATLLKSHPELVVRESTQRLRVEHGRNKRPAPGHGTATFQESN
ncbi:LacI family DNA-binding transcriptional regulator [Acidipila sp. EB88]|uniref:LacI family DNA-binding transcriptional regulator n=1 Tax=Acidipila sp. EB88 TaxID=2305226 RepID=UPI000F5E11DE|nr:LacI family DNA-binding transcriptional regulator [Acidipila sp. EB88]RRA49547.1 LacI family transcriptional regulator [Acidipila sp. EB88]